MIPLEIITRSNACHIKTFLRLAASAEVISAKKTSVDSTKIVELENGGIICAIIWGFIPLFHFNILRSVLLRLFCWLKEREVTLYLSRRGWVWRQAGDLELLKLQSYFHLAMVQQDRL